ncbi:MAG: site-specific DNA-methyltransferase [Oscillospiraceae bacterium]|nr:site-specific DNA-methyltransferase [Oscillospiraceae bacterium]
MSDVRIFAEDYPKAPIGKFIPYANNSRTHSKEQINKLRSIYRGIGYGDPVEVDENFTILSGHGRVEAAKAEGMTELPYVMLKGMSEAEKKAYIIAVNRTALDAGWDEDLLAVEVEALQEMGFDPSLTGLDPAELSDLFDTGEGKEDSFDVDAEMQKPVFSKPGDLWLLGKHRVICGDGTKEEVYTRLMDGQQANLVLTDPPYNVNVEETAGKIMNDNMGDQEFHDFLLAAYKCMFRVLADDGSIYVFHADTEGLNFRLAFKEAGFHLSGCCIWSKNGKFALGRSPYQWAHEPCLFGWKKKHQWYSDRKQTTVWSFDKPHSSKEHPTMKPIPLLCYPMRNSTMTNAIVLDPFLGSGSTLIACCETDRICRGIELDPKFVDVIVRRYQTWCQEQNKSEDICCVRDGRKLALEEVLKDAE